LNHGYPVLIVALTVELLLPPQYGGSPLQESLIE
jgi:hypothetical protein